MPASRFARYSALVLGINLLVIAWGAYVRATGSGAGCGAHWPLCDGEVIPHAPTVQKAIEFTHRASSGLVFCLVAFQAAWAWRVRALPRAARIAAWASFGFMITEALLGALIVVLRKVAQDASLTRAPIMSMHLVNTFLLLASLVLTTWWGFGKPAPRRLTNGAVPWLIAALPVGLILVGVSGAVAALGDTLFPAHSLAQGFTEDLSPTAHIFVKLRALHPLFAVAIAGGLIAAGGVARSKTSSKDVHQLSLVMNALLIAQCLVGFVNVLLRAPIWMQIVHLLLADSTWLAVVVFVASVAVSAKEHAVPRKTAEANT